MSGDFLGEFYLGVAALAATITASVVDDHDYSMRALAVATVGIFWPIFAIVMLGQGIRMVIRAARKGGEA